MNLFAYRDPWTIIVAFTLLAVVCCVGGCFSWVRDRRRRRRDDRIREEPEDNTITITGADGSFPMSQSAYCLCVNCPDRCWPGRVPGITLAELQALDDAAEQGE